MTKFCPHCARPMPTTLLDAAFYLAGDPGLHGRPYEFARDLRGILLRGLELGTAHRARLIELYAERHALNATICRGRRVVVDA
jgi:hypothetical protein